MQKILFLIFSVLLSAQTLAHGPSRQKVTQTIAVDAPIEKVWEIISPYCSIQEWHPSIKTCTTEGGAEVGAVRTVELSNGEKIQEKLYKQDSEAKIIQYAMQLEEGRIIKDMPIATHGAKISLSEQDGQTMIEWKGAFYRAFPGQQPPPELSDERCIEIITEFYKTGLAGIKAKLEK